MFTSQYVPRSLSTRSVRWLVLALTLALLVPLAGRLTPVAQATVPTPILLTADVVENTIEFNDMLFFVKNEELWKSTGTEVGTELVKPIHPRSFAVVNTTLFFWVDDTGHGQELWKTDGSASGTVLVKNISPQATPLGISASPHFTTLNTTLFFLAKDGTSGRELWRSDGTEVGTVMVKDINPGAASAWLDDYELPCFTVMDNTLFFWANDGVHTPQSLWKSDGTESGTVLVKALAPGPSNLPGSDPTLTVFKDTLVFAATDGASGYELWRSDGTESGTLLVTDINPGAGDSFPSYFVELNDTLFFEATDGTRGPELWQSDGTATGTVLVTDINPDNAATDGPGPFTRMNSMLFFTADDGTNGQELWRSDGTAAGTVLVKNINPSTSYDGSYSTLAVVTTTLFFAVDDGTHGQEVWKSDGTAAGTALVKDINPGSLGSAPADFFVSGGTLFFNAADGTAMRFWQSDGTESGTVQVWESSLQWRDEVHGTVFLSGSNGELYALSRPTYSVSGRITDSSGTGIADIDVSDGTRSATTDSTGDYTLTNVPTGSYTLTPTKSGYSFSPATRSITVAGDVTGQDFTALPSYLVSGRITTSSGTGIAGVIVTDGTRGATTDSSGNYTLTGVPAGSYTLMPIQSDYLFSPDTRSTTVAGDVTGQNFTATPLTFSVSGRITTSSGVGLAGVAVSDGTRQAVTDINGDYTLTDVPPGSYTLTPTKNGYSFTPRGISVSGDLPGQNFTATLLTYSVSGRIITSSGAGLAGVAVSDGTRQAVTDINGDYTLTDVPSGNYTLTPTKNGYSFTPRGISVSGDLPGQNFTATLLTYSVSGRVTVNGAGLSGVTISDGGFSATTNSRGNYTLTNLPYGLVTTFTPTKSGYSFSPATYSITVSGNVTGQDFTATLLTFSVSGRVTDSSGAGVTGVAISDDTRSATTDSSGNYTLTSLPYGLVTTFTPTKSGYSFTPPSLRVSLFGDLTGQDFSATLPTYSVSGRVTASSGKGIAGVVVSDGTRNVTTNSNGDYALTGIPAGSYTLTPTKSGYAFSPATRSVTVTGDVSGQDFTRVFQVTQDGLSFQNFRYSGAAWEQFKRTFPNTQMELSSGKPRKGPARYFRSTYYNTIGKKGNSAGFTAVSLIRFLGLTETVEPDLLTPANRAITPVWNWLDFLPASASPRTITATQSDLADYIHLYEARQLSQEYIQWWCSHSKDTSHQVFAAISQYTQNHEPVAVDLMDAHRMTAYRTEQDGTTGYIYVYDSNWPGDTARRITLNLRTGAWSYAMSPSQTWRGTAQRGIRYAPGSLNFPASLPAAYNRNTLLQTTTMSGTYLLLDGDATLRITDSQTRTLGFDQETLINEIPGADYIPILETDTGTFYVPGGDVYTITILPTATGSYTLTALSNGSVMSLDNISISAGTVDTLVLDNGVLQTTITPATDTDYCHSVTYELPDASRDFTTCVQGSTGTSVQIDLDSTGDDLTVENQGSTTITVTATLDQVGTGEQTTTVSEAAAPGAAVTISAESGSTVYLPMIIR